MHVVRHKEKGAIQMDHQGPGLGGAAAAPGAPGDRGGRGSGPFFVHIDDRLDDKVAEERAAVADAAQFSVWVKDFLHPHVPQRLLEGRDAVLDPEARQFEQHILLPELVHSIVKGRVRPQELVHRGLHPLDPSLFREHDARPRRGRISARPASRVRIVSVSVIHNSTRGGICVSLTDGCHTVA